MKAYEKLLREVVRERSRSNSDRHIDRVMEASMSAGASGFSTETIWAALHKASTNIEALEAEVAQLRNIMARAYRAYIKEAWEEGESFESLESDLAWHGIDSPEAQLSASSTDSPLRNSEK